VASISDNAMHNAPSTKVLEVNPLTMVMWVENRVSYTSLEQPDYGMGTQLFGENSTNPIVSEFVEIPAGNLNVSGVTSKNVKFGPLVNYPVDFASVFLDNSNDECVGASDNSPSVALCSSGISSEFVLLGAFLPSNVHGELHDNVTIDPLVHSVETKDSPIADVVGDVDILASTVNEDNVNVEILANVVADVGNIFPPSS
ncbi:unnamed protein product, partial [Citrullus colocynthis]